jgi:Secretion system C-terminal sorting domain/Cleaved Adhesin Domain
MKKITLLLFTLIAFSWHSNAQFTEGFEADIPVSWTVINNGSANAWVQNAAPSGGAQEGTAVASILFDASIAHDDYLITPQIAVTVGVNDRLSYYIKSRSATFLEPYEVLLSTTDALAGSFTVTLQASMDAPNAWTENSFDLSAYAGQSVYVAVRATGTNQWELYVDNVVNDIQPTDTPDWYNIQWLTDGVTGSNTTLTLDAWTPVTVYAQVYEDGVTNAAGQGAGIECWIGGNDGSNTNPSTWASDEWEVAVYDSDQGNNDEYKFDTVADFSGTVYVAARWRLNGGPYVYGGYNGPWNGTTNNNIELIVNPLVANDNCDGAIALTPGATFGTNPVDGTVVSATEGNNASCGSNGPGVWYSIVVPADGNITIEIGPDIGTGDPGFDSVIEAFSGTCGALVSIDCDDDGGAGVFSLLDLIGLTPSSTIYVRVWEYAGDAVEPFAISAYNATLGTNDEVLNSFRYFPNPVNDNLNLRAQSSIQNVSIYNMLGQEVSRISPNTISSDIDMSALQTGVYFVNVTINDTTETIRIIKQ